MNIRTEKPANYVKVRKLHLTSFPDQSEANLVDALRVGGDAVLSLVAENEEQIIGHVMFSKMRAPFKALGLAPVAVLPDCRKQGIADQLIREGIRQAKLLGWEGIFVLGAVDYYQRFGFNLAEAKGFQSPWAGPHFMAMPVQGSNLPEQSGRVDYAPAFDGLD